MNEHSQAGRPKPGGWGAAVHAATDRGECIHAKAGVLVQSLIAAGVFNTVLAIGNMINAFVEHPDEWRRLRKDLSLARSAFEEVDGTLIEAWASMKSFKPKEGEASNRDDDGNGGASGVGGSGQAKAKRRNAERDFHGEKRTNATHASTTDPDARLFKKARGQAAKQCHMAMSSWRTGMASSSMRRLLMPRVRPNGRRR